MSQTRRTDQTPPPAPPRPLLEWLVDHRFSVQTLLDAVTWAVSLTVATWLRYEFRWSSVDESGLASVAALAAVVQIIVGTSFGLYRGRWRFGSFEEVAALTRTTALVTALLFAVDATTSPRAVPLGALVAAGLMSLVLMAAARYAWRLYLEGRLRPHDATRSLVVGAGESGEQLITAMLRNPDSPYLPVALLDDSPRKRNLKIRGVPVAGTCADLVSAARDHDAEAVIVAIPSADAAFIRMISADAAAANVTVQVLPPVEELLDGPVEVADVRPLTDADLLGRHEIDTDIPAIAAYLSGRRVLVTGAGGSIGSELSRQIFRLAPAELVLVDRDESALHGVQLSIDGRAELESDRLVVADIRDADRITEVFEQWRPEVVFHAAALKHVPLLETHPTEAVKTNVQGTWNVLRAAQRSGVARLVNVSSDKAADPINVLGYTKRIAERLTAGVGRRAPATFLSVRFGNVMSSRGSALTTFRAQAANGGPITVTHPAVTRYFMTTEEAVQLVIQAGAIGRSGEVLVLDMGEPVSIDLVARRIAAEAPRPVDIVYTGLRRSEKLHEVLFGTGEEATPSSHPMISCVPVAALDLGVLDNLRLALDDHELVSALRRLAGAGDAVQRPA